MLLTITSTAPPATDLGFLLHKHPDRVQTFEITAGQAHVFYPEASERRCTAALLLEIDPLSSVRGQKGDRKGDRKGAGPEAFSLAQYVNDRPYAAASMLAVALGKVFRTALTGRCDARPDLAATPLPLEITVPALSCRARSGADAGPGPGAALVRRLLEPLGWTVHTQPIPLDPQLPRWGNAPYLALRLSGEQRLADALNQLYVLLPVLDDIKHYWVAEDEVDKLIRAGGSWLARHPERELITRRYLAHQRSLAASAVDRLAEVDDTEPQALDNAVPADSGDRSADDVGTSAARNGARPALPLAQQRRDTVLALLREAGAHTVADLGCGEGALVGMLLDEPAFTRVLGVDVSHRALEQAARRLRTDQMPDRRRERLELFQSSLTYTDQRLAGLDAAVLMEVIEHVDPARLGALERCVFRAARPRTVLVSTPNAEYNPYYPGLAPGAMRHPDHRFEWTRAQFRNWAAGVAARHRYQVRYLPIGADPISGEDPGAGAPTQLAVFWRE